MFGLPMSFKIRATRRHILTLTAGISHPLMNDPHVSLQVVEKGVGAVTLVTLVPHSTVLFLRPNAVGREGGGSCKVNCKSARRFCTGIYIFLLGENNGKKQ